jgi:hypothetical protein
MMKVAEQEIQLPTELSPDSRVWIYQAERDLTSLEEDEMTQELSNFVREWAAHGKNLQADFRIFFNRFVCLFVDESAHSASGCSIDSSVHFIQSLERKYGVQLMQRTQIAYLANDQIRTIEMNDFSDLAKNGEVDSNTLVFNNLVRSLGEMRSGWIVPAKKSWHSRFL